MKRIIITDLTRFKNKEILCTAGIDTNNGENIRPMPYLNANRCKELNMLPGAILTGDFSTDPKIEAPHTEDRNYQNLRFRGHCSSEEFKSVLSNSAHQSIEDGFQVSLEDYQKHIPYEAKPDRSLITIRIDPSEIQIIQDQYHPSKIKAHITDYTGKKYSFLSITDLGLYRYAEKHYQDAGNYMEVNDLIHSQQEVFVRIGLSRLYKAYDGREGYWMQVNGIYSFPNYFEIVRRYE